MNTNQQNNQTTAQNQGGNTMNNMLGGLTNGLNTAVEGLRTGSTNVVNTVSGMSTGKKLMLLAGLAFGANMLRKRMAR